MTRPATFWFVPLIIVVGLSGGFPAGAARVDELKDEIAEKNTAIADIEQEIARYEAQLEEVGAEKQTLQRAIDELNITRRKLASDIRLTEQRIGQTRLSIEEIGIAVSDKERRIAQNTGAIAETIRRINEADSRSLVEIFLASASFSATVDDAEVLRSLQDEMRNDLANLRVLRDDLARQQQNLRGKQHSLEQFKTQLSGQKQVVDTTKSQKDQLLEETANEEERFQSLLEEKRALREAFEEELRAAEEALRVAIDPGSLPPTRSGVLAWPLSKVRLTQHFGTTPFASKNPQVYNGGGHNGVDFGASIGTPIKSVLTGTIVGTGDTDVTCRNASYGKWTLVEHPNGLSTLYAHLSAISVSRGQSVRTGDIIGLSGNTGFSTGPHLHFTVFATQGVKIGTLKSRVCGTNYTIPLADRSAYLNPLSYLPEL